MTRIASRPRTHIPEKRLGMFCCPQQGLRAQATMRSTAHRRDTRVGLCSLETRGTGRQNKDGASKCLGGEGGCLLWLSMRLPWGDPTMLDRRLSLTGGGQLRGSLARAGHPCIDGGRSTQLAPTGPGAISSTLKLFSKRTPLITNINRGTQVQASYTVRFIFPIAWNSRRLCAPSTRHTCFCFDEQRSTDLMREKSIN